MLGHNSILGSGKCFGTFACCGVRQQISQHYVSDCDEFFPEISRRRLRNQINLHDVLESCVLFTGVGQGCVDESVVGS